jgi:hypothetical protein
MKIPATTGTARIIIKSAACMAALLAIAPETHASSHSDAPLIKLDPQANLTDVYTFMRTRPSGERVLVVEVSVRPFCEPGDGVMYDAFSPDALYSIHITHPVTGEETQRYDFKFSPVTASGGGYKNTETILRYGLGTEVGPIQTVGDARQNFTQTYNVTKIVASPGMRKFPVKSFNKSSFTKTVLNGSTPLLVAPPNVGARTTPLYNDENGFAKSGAASRAALDPYTFQTTYHLPGGNTVFCGPREDGFFADTPGIFDLLDGRILGDSLGQEGGGVDGFKGYNVLHYGIVIPVSDLQSFPYTGALQAPGSGVGVYASVSRPQVTIRRSNGENKNSGPYIQVNRLGNPLFNEVLVANVDKDAYNRTSPTSDATLFAKYARNPELPALLNTVFGTSFASQNRVDLVAVFIPDVIRVNTTTGTTTLSGNPGFNRLSFIGGDTILNGDGAAIPAGWPNGRRFGDDVVDIALTAVASGPTFNTITVVGDNVHENDQLYNRTFPYAATPHAGPRNRKDAGSGEF